MNFRCLLIITFLCTFLTQAYSQLFKGGVIAGINGSQVDGDSYYGYNKLGLVGGVYIFMPLTNHFDIQLEMEYQGKGAKTLANDNNDPIYKDQLNYFEMPILIRYNTKKKIGLEGGLGFGYLFSHSETLSGGNVTKQNPFKKFELNYILGIEYKINDQFSALGRYSYSILEIAPTFTNPNTTLLEASSGMFNNVFTVGICYQIGRK